MVPEPTSRVRLGRNVEVQANVEVGLYPRDLDEDTVIGDDSVLRSGTIIYRGTQAGRGLQTGHHALIREHNRLGDRVSVGSHSVIERDSVLEDDVRVHTGCFIPEFVTVRRGAWIGPRVTILNVMHPPCPEFERCAQGKAAEGVDDPRVHAVEIGAGAHVGGNATIGPWVRVGEGALVGAGSVVVRDVPPRTVVAGNPARVVRKVSELECRAGYFRTPYEWEGPVSE